MNTSKIITDNELCRTLTGLSSEKFKDLIAKVHPLWEKKAYRVTPANKRKHAPGAGRRYQLSVEEAVLLVLIRFRTYETLKFLAFLFNKDFSTISRYIQRFEPIIGSVAAIQQDKNALSGEDIMMIVDATEQETERRKGTGYSGKKKRQTIKTQAIIGTDGKAKHVSLSVPGTIHDKKLLDLTKLPKTIRRKMIGDLGYQGAECLVPHKSSKFHKLTAKQKKDNKKHSILRMPVEHFFAHLKQWKILAYRFRSSLKNYNLIFRIVCGLRNMMIA